VVDEGGLEWRGRGRGGGAGTRKIWILQSGDHTRNSEECLDFILCTNLSCQRQIERNNARIVLSFEVGQVTISAGAHHSAH